MAQGEHDNLSNQTGWIMHVILVVEDDEEVLGTVERTLRRQGHQVLSATNSQQAMQRLKTQRPDLVVLDVGLPGVDGIELCRQMRADRELALLPILFLTGRGQVEDKLRGFEAGGDDYVVKPFNVRELQARIQALLRRTQPNPGQKKEPLQAGALSLDPYTFEVQVGPEKRVLLTPTEYQLLHHLMAHAGQVLSAERLLQDVWKYPVGTGDPDLVRAHIRNLRAKIEPTPDRPVYLLTISRHGYTIQTSKSA